MMDSIKLFLAGDVMTGRGIDQILPQPGDPALFEDYVRSADQYVSLAERARGRIERPVDFRYVWGEALEALEREQPDARIVNLETAVTERRTPEPKGINYKMNPANLPVLTAAGLDCCVLANNHVQDWGEAGLRDTIAALDRAGLKVAGAGLSLSEAAEPAIMETRRGHRICVHAVGSETSGIPAHWAAGASRPGVHLLPDLSKRSAERLAGQIRSRKRPGDIVVVSIHWGANWGYAVSKDQRRFAHTLIDAGACDILHGHSSHHPIAMERYGGRLILYGCGDFINDYEGIGGREEYRSDLSVMYLPRLNPESGRVEGLRLVVFQMRQFQLKRAQPADFSWLQSVLNRESSKLGITLEATPDGLEARWS